MLLALGNSHLAKLSWSAGGVTGGWLHGEGLTMSTMVWKLLRGKKVSVICCSSHFRADIPRFSPLPVLKLILGARSRGFKKGRTG